MRLNQQQRTEKRIGCGGIRRVVLYVILIALLPGIAAPTAAHGYIVRAIPENRAVLERAPARLQYWFSEALERDFSRIHVRDQNGNILASGGVSEQDNKLMTVQLPPDLPDGAYVVELRPAFASDGHAVAESRVFFVGTEIGGIAALAARNRAVPLEVVWRVIVLASTLLLFGACTLYAGVLIPAWGSPQHPAGLLPPRVMRRLNWIVGLALAGAFAGNILALIQQTMVFFNADFVQALDWNLISLVRIGSRFGDIWNWRMIFLGIVAAMFALSLVLRQLQPETVRAFWTANAWMTALVIGTFSVVSHAAGSLLLPWVGIGVDWLHALGVGFWAGGLAALVLVLPAALQPYTGAARRLALLAALRRFSRFAAAAVFVVVMTGIYSATNWIYTPSDLNTHFGGTLGLKLLLVGLLLGVGAWHQVVVNPERYRQLLRHLRITNLPPASENQGLTRTLEDEVENVFSLASPLRHVASTLRLEVALVLVVLCAVGWLSATPVPVPEFAQREVAAPTDVQMAGDLTVALSILPGGPGVNTYDTTVTRNGQRVEGLNIRLRKVQPAADRRGVWHTAEAAEPGLYVAAGDEINQAGRWWTLLDITLLDGEQRRVAFDWMITNEASVIQSIRPNVGHLAAWVGISVAVGAAVYPFIRRVIALLNLDAPSLAVASGAVIAAGVVLTVGYNIIQESRQNYAETLSPTPQVVNAVLPTQASLDRGRVLYEQHCIGWQSVPRDFAALRERLPRTRDEELYFATLDGWRGLPPCDGDLSFYQRWDIVNYVRTFEAVEPS